MTATRVATFSERLKLARAAWKKYCDTVPGDPEKPPALFIAGFTLGMLVEQDEGRAND